MQDKEVNEEMGEERRKRSGSRVKEEVKSKQNK